MSTDRARLRELLAADPHEQRRTVEKLLASKNECSTDLHYRGTELIRTHEVLLDALPALLDALDEAEKALREIDERGDDGALLIAQAALARMGEK